MTDSLVDIETGHIDWDAIKKLSKDTEADKSIKKFTVKDVIVRFTVKIIMETFHFVLNIAITRLKIIN